MNQGYYTGLVFTLIVCMLYIGFPTWEYRTFLYSPNLVAGNVAQMSPANADVWGSIEDVMNLDGQNRWEAVGAIDNKGTILFKRRKGLW